MRSGQGRRAGGSAPGCQDTSGVGTSCGPGIRTRASPTLCPSVSLGNSPGSFSWQCPLHTPQDQNPPKALAGPRGEPPLPLGLCFLLREVEPQKHGCKLGSRVVTVSVGLLVGQTTYLPCPGHGSAHAGPLVPEPGCRLAANVVLPAAFIQGRSHHQACRR